MDNSKELKGWLQRKFSLDFDDIKYVVEIFTEIIENYGFTIIKKTDFIEGIFIESIYGSKVIAFLVNLIPFIGSHLSSGKRFGLKANIKKNNSSIDISINITPYMELFNTSEVLALSQSADEKATDEYSAAKKIHVITKDIYSVLNISLPEEFAKFDTKAFASDLLLSFLIYPLDDYKSSKKIHLPTEGGPKWCWSAFIIPEVWFIWNEIWGVSIVTILVEIYGFRELFQLGVPISVIVSIAIIIRFICGRIANKIYYLKYGKWLK